MSQRGYCRFSIPLTAIETIQRRRIIAAALGTTVDELAPAFAQDPTTNEVTAGYDSQMALRFVEGVVCLVTEDKDCKFGGAQIADDLQEASIPFLHFTIVGPARSAFTGSGDLHWIDCDANGNPVMTVDVEDGKAVVDPDALVIINDFLAAVRAVLRPT